MTRNVTLRMDDELLGDLRHRAVDAHMSLSAWITATLKDMAPPLSEFTENHSRATRRMETVIHSENKSLSRACEQYFAMADRAAGNSRGKRWVREDLYRG